MKRSSICIGLSAALLPLCGSSVAAGQTSPDGNQEGPQENDGLKQQGADAQSTPKDAEPTRAAPQVGWVNTGVAGSANTQPVGYMLLPQVDPLAGTTALTCIQSNGVSVRVSGGFRPPRTSMTCTRPQ